MSSFVVFISQTPKFGVFALVDKEYHEHGLCLQSCATKILSCPDLSEKIRLSELFVNQWQEGIITEIFDSESQVRTIPTKPARAVDKALESQPIASILKSRGLNKNSIEVSLHGIAHAESWALELFWDVIARFQFETMPREFYDDMVRIAGQEANHFKSWADRLDTLNCPYGSLPTHEGLWRAAESTCDSLLNRILSINLIHEARGLDTYPLTQARFAKVNDNVSAAILDRNFAEEITHVACGVKWFVYLCQRQGLDPQSVFHERFPMYYKGNIKEANLSARYAAGLPESWLAPFL